MNHSHRHKKTKPIESIRTAIASSRNPNIFFLAFVLGAASVIGALAIGTIAYRNTLEATEKRFQSFYMAKAKMLAATAQLNSDQTDESLLKSIEAQWRTNSQRPDDEYICVLDKDARLISHTTHPQAIGKYAGDNLVLGNDTQTPCRLRNLIDTQQDYVGDFVSSTGQHQIAAFTYLPNQNWVLGVHRSKAAVINEVKSGIKGLRIGFITACGFLMPLSLLLLAWAFSMVQNRRRTAEHELRESEEKFRKLFEQSNDAIFISDLDGRILDANDRACQMLSYSKEQLLTMTVMDISSEECVVPCAEVVRQVRKEGVVRFEGRMKRSDDTIIDAEIISSVIDYTEGIVQAIARNITERKQFEQELKQSKENAELMTKEALEANRIKSEFLANMSHEIRTPMNGIIGFSDLLAGELKGEQKVRIDVIKDCAGSLLNIINDILDFSTIEAGRLGTEIVDCSLIQQLDSVEQLIRPKAEKKAIDFKIIKEKNLPAAIRTDPTRLRQCLINLTDNAVKFTKQGHVHVTVSQQQTDGKPFIRFEIEDTGIGISPKEQEMIFEPFTQSDGSTSREFGGTGLGLAITRQLTELLGGDISVTSEPGKGSVFTLLLPAGVCQTDQIPADTPDSKEYTPQENENPPCILVAEDDRNNQKLVALMLDHLRYKRVIVNDGEEAVQAAIEQKFDLILMDIQMPVMNGYEATRRLRANGITVPIVAITARAMASDREKCIAAGCTDYLPKPININSLGDIIAKNLAPVATAK